MSQENVEILRRAISHLQARARSATGVLSTVQTLSGSGTHPIFPQVGVDADGNAIFAWPNPPGVVRARERSATGVLGPVQPLSGPGAGDQQIAVNSDGHAVIVWVTGEDASGDTRIAAAF